MITEPATLAAVPSSNNIVREGESVNFTCVVLGIPTPSIKWRKKEEQNFLLLGEENSLSITSEVLAVPGSPNKTSSVLEFSNISASAAGVYQCVGENVAGMNGTLFSDTHNFSLIVHSKSISDLSYSSLADTFS